MRHVWSYIIHTCNAKYRYETENHANLKFILPVFTSRCHFLEWNDFSTGNIDKLVVNI